MTKFTLGKLILIAISTCIHTTAFAVISSPISGQVGSTGSFENIITEPPDIIDVPLPERPINPSLSAWPYQSSNVEMGVIYTCAKGFNTLYRRKSTDTFEQTISVEPCDKGRLTDTNVEPATTYCYRLETVTSDGTRKNAESCSTASPVRVSFKQLLTTPEESSQVLSDFNWEETAPVAEDTGGQVSLPFIYYMNILVNGGIYWTLGQNFNLGLDLRYSQADVTFFGTDVEAGGAHVDVILGYHW